MCPFFLWEHYLFFAVCTLILSEMGALRVLNISPPISYLGQLAVPEFSGPPAPVCCQQGLSQSSGCLPVVINFSDYSYQFRQISTFKSVKQLKLPFNIWSCLVHEIQIDQHLILWYLRIQRKVGYNRYSPGSQEIQSVVHSFSVLPSSP